MRQFVGIGLSLNSGPQSSTRAEWQSIETDANLWYSSRVNDGGVLIAGGLLGREVEGSHSQAQRDAGSAMRSCRY